MSDNNDAILRIEQWIDRLTHDETALITPEEIDFITDNTERTNADEDQRGSRDECLSGAMA